MLWSMEDTDSNDEDCYDYPSDDKFSRWLYEDQPYNSSDDESDDDDDLERFYFLYGNQEIESSASEESVDGEEEEEGLNQTEP